MLTRRQAEAKGDEIVRDARLHLRRNNPPINLMPLYYRWCPELKQFPHFEACANVRAANRDAAGRGWGLVLCMFGGVILGRLDYSKPANWGLALLAAALTFGVSMWRLRRRIAELCEDRLPELLATGSVEVR